MKKIILTGGGTAGHVTPNISLIPELQKEGYITFHKNHFQLLKDMKF